MAFNDVIFSRIGTVVTLLAAAGSFYGWHKSNQSATKAEAAVDRINLSREIRDAGGIYSQTCSIIKTVSKIGTASNEEKMQGVDITSIASELNDFINFIAENTHTQETKKKIDFDCATFCEDVRSDIPQLTDAVSIKEQLEIGRRIYTKIVAFQPHAKNLADNLTFKHKDS